ncbi:MAG: hypothetical protein OIF32_02360 [Campylobacterales bacterium]|nr:hypothetical protein [Campylobacterales bacterium]
MPLSTHEMERLAERLTDSLLLVSYLKPLLPQDETTRKKAEDTKTFILDCLSHIKQGAENERTA